MPRLKILEPLWVRDFAVFWAGWTVSLLGDGVFYVAIAWQVYDLKNAPTALAAVGVAETIPLVAFVLVGGVVTDRFDRRLVLLWASLVRGLCVAVLGVLALGGSLQLWHVFVLAVVYGAGQAFQGPAAGSIVPDLVPPGLLVQANSLSQFVRPLAFRLVGPALGGLIVHELGTGAAFLADAGTFGWAALMLLFVSPRGVPRDGDAPTSMLRDIREGMRFARAHTWLWGTLGWAFLALLLTYGPFEVLVPYVVKNELGGDAGDLGLVFAAGGIGAVVVSLVVGQYGLPSRHISAMYLAWGLGVSYLAVFAVARAPWHAMLIAAYGEACFAMGLLVWVTLMQRVVPRGLLGRVKSLDWLVSLGLVPLSFALTGPAAAWLGAETVLVGAGIAGGILTAVFYLLPGMRDTERDEHPARVVLSGELEPAQP